MSTISFVKYQGAGNDFILIDDRAHSFDRSLPPLLCHRRFGIGADGVILLQTDSVADFRMRIFNPDGSEATSCGNGLRCLMQFIADLGLSFPSCRIATTHRIVRAQFVGDQICVEMGRAQAVQRVYIDEREIYFLDTGVPHAVLFVPDVQTMDLLQEGAALRHHPRFHPQGTNVNFVSLRSDGSLSVRTFERGVEGETLCCGTGAAAVGWVAVRKGMRNPMPIHFAGGVLLIQIDTQGHITMTGEARKVFEGTYCKERLVAGK